jgi:amino-acid N-acetyltransferase
LFSAMRCARIPDMESKLRRARVGDVGSIHRLINGFADRGDMLPRSLNELYENLRDWLVVENQGETVACCAAHVTWEDLAEIKGLAVREDHQGRDIGSGLVRACLEDARSLAVPRIFVLTFIPEYFERFGFRRVDKSDLPQKVWSECIRCPKFPDCGEVGMILDLQ